MTRKTTSLTADQIEWIRQNYAALPKSVIAQTIGIHITTLFKLAHKYNFRNSDVHLWSKEELDILRTHHHTCTVNDLTRLLPRKSVAAIRTQLKKLNGDYVRVAPTRLSNLEVDLLRSLAKQGYTIKEAQTQLPHKTHRAIWSAANRRGIHFKRQCPPFSEKEDAILREYYPHTSIENLLKYLPSRNWDAIKARAYVLRVPRLIAKSLLFGELGRRFENIVHNLKILANEAFERHPSTPFGQPDFIVNSKEWHEVKLADATIFHHNCESLKYLQYVSHLTVIYLIDTGAARANKNNKLIFLDVETAYNSHISNSIRQQLEDIKSEYIHLLQMNDVTR